MFKVVPIPAFDDNYIWAIHSPDGKQIAVVDPGSADAVSDYLKRSATRLAAILITHHHQDHTGGVAQLVSEFEVPVYGPADSPFRGITKPLRDADSLRLFGSQFTVKAVPAHTLDHIAYLVSDSTPQLFCGDTLFLAGCGRLFEGSAAQMLAAMNYFKSLPDETEVYCTHEYSLANLRFAQAVEPNNPQIQATMERCGKLREQNQPTLPSQIAVERAINPYMRVNQPEVRKQAEQFSGQTLESDVSVLAAVREWKNSF